MLVSVNVDHARVLRRPAGGRRRRGARLRRRRPRLAPARRARTAAPTWSAARCSGSGCPPPSATRTELLTWLQGSGAGHRPARVVAPRPADPTASAGARRPARSSSTTSARSTTPPPSSRRCTGARSGSSSATPASRSRSSASCCGQRESPPSSPTPRSSVDERRRSEQAFAEARDCVIVSTSTLELGIDVGDLDRVIQIDAPAPSPRSCSASAAPAGGRAPRATACSSTLDRPTPAARRRPAAAAGAGAGSNPSSRRPSHGTSSPSRSSPLCLQEHQVGDQLWHEWWNGLDPFDPLGRRRSCVTWSTRATSTRDGGMLFIGPEAERRFGHRHFMELTAVFTAPPRVHRAQRAYRDSAGSTRPCSPRRSRARAGCCSAAGAGGSPTSTGTAAAASSSRPTVAARPAGPGWASSVSPSS